MDRPSAKKLIPNMPLGSALTEIFHIWDLRVLTAFDELHGVAVRPQRKQPTSKDWTARATLHLQRLEAVGATYNRSMYQSSVPTCVRTLTNLAAILEKAEAHAEPRKIEPAALLTARLFPDMLPLPKTAFVSDATRNRRAGGLSTKFARWYSVATCGNYASWRENPT